MLLADREALRLADARAQTQEEELDCEAFLLGEAALAEGAESSALLLRRRARGAPRGGRAHGPRSRCGWAWALRPDGATP
jgi:hypothetical protein